MLAKLLIAGTITGIGVIAIVAFFGGFTREALDSYALDYAVGVLTATGIGATVGMYLIGKRRVSR